jgi:hypothetical protein
MHTYLTSSRRVIGSLGTLCQLKTQLTIIWGNWQSRMMSQLRHPEDQNHRLSWHLTQSVHRECQDCTTNPICIIRPMTIVTIHSTPCLFLCLPFFISVYLELYHLLSLTALEAQPLSHAQLLLCSISPLSSILRSPLFPISVYHCPFVYINPMYFDSLPQLDLSWAIHIVVLDSSVWWKYSRFASALRNLV